MVSEVMCCFNSLMIEDGAFSHRIDYVTILIMALNSNKQLCLEGKKKIKRLSEHFYFLLGYNAKTIVI